MNFHMKLIHKDQRFDVLRAVLLKIQDFRDVMLYHLVSASWHLKNYGAFILTCQAVQEELTSEMPRATHQTTQRHIPENMNLQIRSPTLCAMRLTLTAQCQIFMKIIRSEAFIMAPIRCCPSGMWPCVWSHRWVPMFQGNLLFWTSTLKTDATGFSETTPHSVTIQTTTLYIFKKVSFLKTH